MSVASGGFAWGSGRLGAQARVGQIGCHLGDDQEGQRSFFLDCALGQHHFAVATNILAAAENPEYSRSARIDRLKGCIHLLVLGYYVVSMYNCWE